MSSSTSRRGWIVHQRFPLTFGLLLLAGISVAIHFSGLTAVSSQRDVGGARSSLRTKESAEETSAQGVDSSQAELRVELKRLEDALLALRSEQEEQRRIILKLAEAGAMASPSSTKAPSAHLSPREHQERELLLLDQLDRRFAGEVRDAAWGEAMEGQIGTVIHESAGSQALAAECLASLCRTEVRHESLEAQELFIEKMLSSSAARGGSFVKPVSDEDGSVRSIVYLAREGQVLEPEPS